MIRKNKGKLILSSIVILLPTVIGLLLWEQLPERFLLGAGSRYPALSQGGEERHTLTLAEMPAHSHTSYGWAFTNDTQGSIALRADGQAEDYKTRSSGGGEGHNNMPPYLAVYMWKRVK